MSTAFPNTATAAGEPGSQSTPTMTRHEQLAAEVEALLDKAIEIIPNLETPHQSTIAFVRSHRNIPIPFMRTTIRAVEQTPVLQGLNKLDPVVARERLQIYEAFQPVLDQLLLMYQRVKFTIDAGYSTTAADCLQVLAVARGLTRDPGSAALAAHVEHMVRDLGRTRPRPRAATPPPFVMKAA